MTTHAMSNQATGLVWLMEHVEIDRFEIPFADITGPRFVRVSTDRDREVVIIDVVPE